MKLTLVIALTFCITFGSIYQSRAQNLDSIYSDWQNLNQNDTVRIQSLLRYARYGYLFSNPDSANYFAQIASNFAKEKGIKNWYSEALKIQGISYAIRGFNGVAIDYFNEALLINEELNDSVALAGSINNVGLLHKETGDLDHALEYLQRSYKMYLALNDLNGKALCSGNIGTVYNELGNHEKGLEWNKKSLAFYEEMGQTKGIANSLSSIGSSYASLGDSASKANSKKDNDFYLLALDFYEKSLVLRRKVNDQEGIAITLNGMGKIYMQRSDLKKSEDFLLESLTISQQVGSMSGIESSAYSLFELYQIKKQHKTALEMLLLSDAMNDSIMSEENQRAVIKQEFEYNYEKQQLEDSLKNEATVLQLKLENEKKVLAEQHNKNIFMLSGIGVLVIAIGLWSRLQYIRNAKSELQKEKDISDNLLLNILPQEVAEELKNKGYADTKQFEQTSILFTDFKEFTETSEKLSAKDLVGELNHCFKEFDSIMEEYGVEKIKTIGDAYMAAGGLPTPEPNYAKNTVLAALKMQAFISDRKIKMNNLGKTAFEMRVGIHTGPVVAGIVGIKKFQYDIWGDTVNTASRIESHGDVGKVNISQATYEHLKDDPDFRFENRGKIEVKGKGEMEMWFVSNQS